MLREFEPSRQETLKKFHQPTDAITGAPIEPQAAELRCMSSAGEVTFNPATGIARSPLIGNGQQDIPFMRYNNTSHGLRIEGKLLEILMRNSEAVFTNEELFNQLWGFPGYDFSKDDYLILQDASSQLRKMLGDKTDDKNKKNRKRIIRTVLGVGLTMASDEQLIAESNQFVRIHPTKHGNILHNYKALLVRSPFVGDGKTPIQLMPTENELLHKMLQRGNNSVMDYEYPVYPKYRYNYLAVLVRNLRKKIGDKNVSEKGHKTRFQLIERIKGGYRLARPVEEIPVLQASSA